MKRSALAILVGIILILLLCGQLQGQSRIYYHVHESAIHWTNTSATTVSTLSLTHPFPVSIAIDQRDGWLYWLTTGSLGHGYYGELYRSRLHDWANFERLMETGYTEGGLEIDAKDGFIYWTAPVVAEPVGEKVFSIVRTSLDAMKQEVWIPSVSEFIGGMDSDVNNRLLFWTGGSALMRAHFDKGYGEVVEIDWAAAGLPEPPEYFGGVALDTMYRKIYWSQAKRPDWNPEGYVSRIYRAQYMGGMPTIIYEAQDASIRDVEFDPVSRTLYWVETRLDAAKTTTRYVMKAAVGGPLPLSGTEVFAGAIGISLFADPGAAGLVSPEPDAETMTSVTLEWDEVLGSSRYDVVVANDPDFLDVVYHENLPWTSAEFVAPFAGQSYFWRVQSNACFIAPHWSETRAMQVGHTGPLAVTLTHPTTDARIEPSETFTWTSASNAAVYTLEIADQPNFSPVLKSETGLTDTSLLVEGLERGVTYFWRVAGHDDVGRFTYTAPVAFSVAQLLSAVNLVAPGDGSTGIPTRAKLEWGELEGAQSYDIEVSTSVDFSALVLSTSTSEREYTFDAPLAYQTMFYWRVRGVNQSGAGDWSDAWVFTTAVGTSTEELAEVPQATVLASPYPNPVGGVVTVPVEIAEPVAATIEVFDVAGRRLGVFRSERSGPARFSMHLDASSWPPGQYLVVLNGDRRHAKPLLVVH